MLSSSKAIGLEKAIVQGFRVHGLTLRKTAVRYLVEELNNVVHEESQWSESIDTIVEHVEQEDLPSSLVPTDVLQNIVEKIKSASASATATATATASGYAMAAVEEDADIVDEGLSNAGDGGVVADTITTTISMTSAIVEARRYFHVIDIKDIPCLYYHTDRKTFLSNSNATMHPHSTANAKNAMFRERYRILRQRILRHALFTAPAFGASSVSSEYYSLTQIESLLGMDASDRESICIFGMLSQIEEGKWHVEDLNGRVEVNLSEATSTVGMFTEGCFVVIEGSYDDVVKMFNVRVLGMPPPESRALTDSTFVGIDFFGGPSVTPSERDMLISLERRAENAMLVVLSDVHLDRPTVRERMRTLFSGYSSGVVIPIAFILMGNFVSEPYGSSHVSIFRESLDALGDILLNFPRLIAQSKFLFVPGPQDLGAGNVIPRPPLAASLTAGFRSKIPNAKFVESPCRVRYCNKDIVICRENLLGKMRRHCIIAPNEDINDELAQGEPDMTAHLTKTLLDQAHLSPLSLTVQPIYWARDHALRLYPMPSVLILGDKYDQFEQRYEQCMCFNPGPFEASEFSFMVYWLAQGEVEHSKIN